MEYKDYYQILEVDKKATKDEIKKSYRKLAKKYHPDLNKGDETSQEKFKDINEAYEVLGDDEKRKQYDMFGSQGGFRGGQNFNPQDFGFGGYQQAGDAGGFSDFFNMIFGGQGGFSGFGKSDGGSSVFSNFGRPNRQKARQQYSTEITITLKEAFEGTERKLRLGINGQNVDVPVKVPKGIQPGKKIKLRGEPHGFEGADIFVKINLAMSDQTLDGLDITQELSLYPWEAWFGTKKTVDTLHGRLKVNVPKEVKNGQKIRLAGKGFRDMKGNTGDLYLRFVLDNPTHLTKEQEEAYRSLMEK